ncbi:Na+/H+ antiporter subunit E [Motiliproteus sediminis]|uniref:Na+/H+ antiporter subunit E n=1 Tax=Motiliproteus sediminis TaxID=1468178 RepID=UPI001AEFBC3F|nr:Na+/H+ antiporter subunit E [Motiliproteus sediminis]
MKTGGLSRWLPLPLQTAVLVVVWLLLNNSMAPGQILLGVVLAWLVSLLVAPLQEGPIRVRRFRLAGKYLLRLLKDIVVANFDVAARILRSRRHLKPGFVAVPLDIRGDLPVSLLANTVSLTPGTVSAELSSDRCWLYVHALHLEDDTVLIKVIKERYEQPLREIFEC